jgi:zinc and cadmium transporter
MAETILGGIFITLISLSGLFFVTHKAKHWMFRNMKYLVSFAAGIFFMTAFSVAGETFELLSPRIGVLAILIGFSFMWILHMILPETHHHHDHECTKHAKHNRGLKIVIGDTVHNTADGIVLVTAFSVSTELGIFAAVSIFVHEFVQEISEFFVLRESGYSVRQALLINAVSALTIFIGIGIGMFLTETLSIQGFLLGITAGIFFHIVVHDLFPFDSVRQIHKRNSWKHLCLFLCGVCVLMGVGLMTPHGHGHENEFETLDNH